MGYTEKLHSLKANQSADIKGRSHIKNYSVEAGGTVGRLNNEVTFFYHEMANRDQGEA